MDQGFGRIGVEPGRTGGKRTHGERPALAGAPSRSPMTLRDIAPRSIDDEVASVTYEAYFRGMSGNAQDLPITAARDRLADVVNEAAYTGQVTYLTRRGRRLAAIVSVEAAEAAERWEDEQLGRMADDALAEMARTGERPVPLDEVRAELGL